MIKRTLMALLLVIVTFCAASRLPQQADALQPDKNKSLEGVWQAKIPAGAITATMLLEFKKTAGISLSGTLSVLEQPEKEAPIDEMALKDNGEVRFQIKKSNISFEGKMAPAGDKLTGVLTASGVKLPLTFVRIDKKPVLARPQEPKKPYPYNSEDITYENAKAQIKFTGTLTWPKTDGPHPAVVLLSGSGPQDRDSTMLGHKPFLVLADYLTRKGIAVLRVDDRGVGGSGGSVFLATLNDEADDALSAIAFLKARKEIDGKKIGLIGHSEGGTVAPIVASKSNDVAFIVMLAGTGVPGDEVMYLQGQAILKATGEADAALLTRQKDFQKKFFKIATEETDQNKALARLDKMLDETNANVPEGQKAQLEQEKKNLTAQLKLFLTPWFRSFLLHNPATVLKKVHCPVLVLNGSLDLQVTPKENLPAITNALKEGGNKDVTIKELPKLNHLFQTAKTGAPSEYSQIEETIAPVVLEMVADWIVSRTKK